MKFAVVLGGLLLIGALGAGAYMFISGGGFSDIFGDSSTRQPPQRLPTEETTDTETTATAQTAQIPASDTNTVETAAPVANPGGPLRFNLPIDCTIGQNCIVQNYVDMAGGEDYADYACGTLSYDGHKGTDIRLPSYKEMEAGVNVLAAAAGVVRRARDGMPDVNFRLVGRDAVSDRGLGNTVIIRHADGLVTGYGHMKRGSILVKEGDQVQAGQPIGQIGLSGLSEFPHVHFEVRRNNTVLDPFTGLESETLCGAPDQPLWSEQALAKLKYFPSLVMRIGIANKELNRAAIEYGLHQSDDPIDRLSESLLLHVYVAGLRAGDVARFQLVDPAGETFIDTERNIDQNAAVQLLRAGAAERTTPWDPGAYRGVFTLTRDENGQPKTVLKAETTVEVR